MANILSLSSLDERPRRIRRAKGFVDEVVELIRSDIMSLRIPPDTRISIDALARQLGVSQTPIREALNRLEAMGLVSKQRFVGYCSIPQLTPEKLTELFELRLLLEPYAARCAAERITDTELQAIAALASKLAASDAPKAGHRFGLQDFSGLHSLIADATHNSLIAEALSSLHVHIHIFRVQLSPHVSAATHAELGALIRAITRRQPAAAEAAMRNHIQKSFERLQALHG